MPFDRIMPAVAAGEVDAGRHHPRGPLHLRLLRAAAAGRSGGVVGSDDRTAHPAGRHRRVAGPGPRTAGDGSDEAVRESVSLRPGPSGGVARLRGGSLPGDGPGRVPGPHRPLRERRHASTTAPRARRPSSGCWRPRPTRGSSSRRTRACSGTATSRATVPRPRVRGARRCRALRSPP